MSALVVVLVKAKESEVAYVSRKQSLDGAISRSGRFWKRTDGDNMSC